MWPKSVHWICLNFIMKMLMRILKEWSFSKELLLLAGVRAPLCWLCLTSTKSFSLIRFWERDVLCRTSRCWNRNNQASFWVTNRWHEALTEVFISQAFKHNTLGTALCVHPYLLYIKACLMVPFLLVTISLFKQSTSYSEKSNNFIFLVYPIHRDWKKQDDRKAQKMGSVNAVTLSEGPGGRYFALPISVTLSWVHLCQKSSELSAACQASKRFLEKILLHIPRKWERCNKQCGCKHELF